MAIHIVAPGREVTLGAPVTDPQIERAIQALAEHSSYGSAATRGAMALPTGKGSPAGQLLGSWMNWPT